MKGNIPIPKADVKMVCDGRIIKDLPLIEYNGSRVPLFTILHPDVCKVCGAPLRKNKTYTRYVVHFSDVLMFEVASHQCSNPGCRKSYSDQILGVDRGKNYSNPFLTALNDAHFRGNSPGAWAFICSGIPSDNSWKFEWFSSISTEKAASTRKNSTIL